MRENPKFMGRYIDDQGNIIATKKRFVGWHSRSVAVTVIIVDPVTKQFLVELRGPGCPDNIGKYVMPCGYLNWDETLADACEREVYEETGLRIDKSRLKVFGIQDSPEANRQNVTIRHLYIAKPGELQEAMNNGTINIDTVSRGGEIGECDAITLVDLDWVNTHASEFAFGHEYLINMADEYCKAEGLYQV